MHVAPRPGLKYRDTRTKQFVPAEGFPADPNDLDIVRAIKCGDLVEVPDPAAARRIASKDNG